MCCLTVYGNPNGTSMHTPHLEFFTTIILSSVLVKLNGVMAGEVICRVWPSFLGWWVIIDNIFYVPIISHPLDRLNPHASKVSGGVNIGRWSGVWVWVVLSFRITVADTQQRPNHYSVQPARDRATGRRSVAPFQCVAALSPLGHSFIRATTKAPAGRGLLPSHKYRRRWPSIRGPAAHLLCCDPPRSWRFGGCEWGEVF